MITFDAGRVPSLTFGAGRRSELPQVLAAQGVESGPVLLVADAILADLGPAHEMADRLATAGYHVELAAEISGEPKEAVVDLLAQRSRTSGARALVGLGGGAAMDAAKLVAGIAGAEAPAGHYALCRNPFPQTRLPAIAVPTTAGTGSEVTRTSIVSTADGLKYWYWGEELMFAHAILDPDLCLTLPPAITAWTGMDAVAHALESVTSRSSNPVGQMFGFEALRLLSTHLPRAVADGADVQARGHVLWASTVAGLALHNCNTHMGHNISHALGSLAPVHHGLATGLALHLTLPTLVARPEGAVNFANASSAMGGACDATALPETFDALMRAVGIAPTLPDACDHVTAEALAAQMKAPANRGMADNAPSPITDDDLDRFAETMLSLGREEAAA